MNVDPTSSGIPAAQVRSRFLDYLPPSGAAIPDPPSPMSAGQQPPAETPVVHQQHGFDVGLNTTPVQVTCPGVKILRENGFGDHVQQRQRECRDSCAASPSPPGSKSEADIELHTRFRMVITIPYERGLDPARW